MYKRFTAILICLSLLFSIFCSSALALEVTGVQIDTSVYGIPLTVSETYNDDGETSNYSFSLGGFGVSFIDKSNITAVELGAAATQALLDSSFEYIGDDGDADFKVSMPPPGDTNRNHPDPTGYISPGTPAVNASGKLFLTLEPYGVSSISNVTSFGFTSNMNGFNFLYKGSSFSLTSSGYSSYYSVYSFVAPYDGFYYVGSSVSPLKSTSGRYIKNGLLSEFETVFTFTTEYELSKSCTKGDFCYFVAPNNPNFRNCMSVVLYLYPITVCVDPLESLVTTVNNITTINNTTITGDTIYKDTTNNTYYSYTDNTCTVYYVDDSNKATSSVTYNEGDENYYVTVYQPVSVTPTTPPSPTTPPGTLDPTATPGPVVPVPTLDPDAVYNVNVLSVGEWFTEFAADIKGYFNALGVGIAAGFAELSADIKGYFGALAAGIAAGFADLSANFTLAIDKLSISFENTFNKYMGTPETAQPSTTPGPLASPEPSASPAPSSAPVPSATPESSATPSPSSGPGQTPLPSTSPGQTPVPSASPGQTPAPSTSPTPPLEDEEEVDSIFLQWLRHLIDGAAAATAPLEEVGGTFVEFFAMLPDEVKATLTGALCILLVAGMWKFFGG